MVDLDDCDDLPAARAAILASARAGGASAAAVMLMEALRQMEILAPLLSAEVWSGYAAVLAATTTEAQSVE